MSVEFTQTCVTNRNKPHRKSAGKLYQSLILPYLTYGLEAWGQAAKPHLQKILGLQKRALRLMCFSEPRAHAVPLFISSKILPLQMLYAEKVSSIMFDVSYMNAPSNICDFFTKANSKHKHETRFSSFGKTKSKSKFFFQVWS